MVPNPDIQTLVESVRRRGLLLELSRLVGSDEARLLIREAWVSLDDPPGSAARKPVGFIWHRGQDDEVILPPGDMTIVYTLEESNDQ